MKKLVFVILLACAVMLSLSACGETETTTTTAPTQTTAPIQSTTAPEGITLTSKSMTLDGTSLSGQVSHATETFNFSQDITVSGGTSWILTFDIYGLEPIPSKTVPLVEGENIFYIFVTLPDQSMQDYTVHLYRNHMYTVRFATRCGETIPAQQVEEGELALEPSTSLSRAGYTFSAWDYDFANPITQNVTIYANWTANTNTPYRVEYYLQNLEDDNYPTEPNFVDNFVGTTDTTVYAEQKVFKHFTLNSTKSIMSGNVNGNGDLVLQVYYTRNVYTLSNATSQYGSISNSGAYKYGGSIITTKATAFIGCQFLGWYDGNGALLSTDETFTFTTECDVEARFTPTEEMSNFHFSSTTTTCTITGIKDKTVSEIIVPDYVTAIDDYAFAWYDSLTNVVIGDSVTSIGESAFYSCSNLQYNEYDNAYYLGNSENPYLILVKSKNTSITSCIIHENTKFIHSDAFYVCTRLTSVVIGNGVTSIGEDAFRYCTRLTSVVIGNAVTSIGSWAFYDCTSLTSVVIGNGVTSIGSRAFYDCTSLDNIYYRGTEAQWQAISKGEDWAHYYSNNTGNYYTIKYTITYNYTGE